MKLELYNWENYPSTFFQISAKNAEKTKKLLEDFKVSKQLEKI